MTTASDIDVAAESVVRAVTVTTTHLAGSTTVTAGLPKPA